MSKNNVRIAIRDSTDSHNVAFFDNKAGIKYKSANLQRFLAGSASILTIKYSSKDIDSIRSGCKLAFRYKNRDYWLNVMNFEKKGFEVELTAYSLGLELNNETRGEHKPANAMSIAEYVAYYDPEHALTIGVNEVSDKRIKLEWTGTDTILARLFSVANSFGAELDFNVELNDDYSLKRQVLNIYKKGNLGTNKVSQPVRVGKELKVINYSDNIKELRTAVRATGKDGLTIDGLNKKIYDNNKELLYYSSGMTVYAPQSRDRFPSVGKGSNDNWIVKDLGETQYETKEALWGYMYGEIQKISVPEITYEVEGAIDAGIGDTQTLIDDIHFEPTLYVQARVSELEDDILTGKVTKSTFINFERKYSQIADVLLKQIEALAEDAAPYIIRLSTNNGYIFKNGEGSSTITARLEKYSKDIAATWKWVVDNKVVGTGDKLTVKAEQVTNTMAVTVIAYVNGNEVVRDYMTFSNSDDGVGVESIDRYFTSSDQSDGVTIEGAGWSDKPPAPTEDGKYLWAYDKITYTDGTVTTTKPAAVGANFDVDAFRAEIAEDLKDVPNREEFENKIAEELANSKAEITTQIETAKTQAETNAKEYADTINQETAKVAELANAAAGEIKADLVNVKNNLTATSLVANNAQAAVDAAKQDLANVTSDLNTAKQNLANSVDAVNTKVDSAKAELTQTKQQLTNVANDLSQAKTDLQNAVSAVDTKATNLKSDLTQAKQDLASQAQQLQAQANAQSELTNRVSSVEKTANGTKTTVSELSKTVAQNGKDITSVTARTKVVEDDLAGTKTTLSQVQTTANSASQKTATLETGLNGLSAKFETLKIGSRNYFKDSKSRKYYIDNRETQDVRTFIDDEFWQNDTRFTKNFVRMSFDIAFDPALPSDFTTNVHFSASPWYSCGGITFKGGTTALQHFDLKFDLSGASNSYKTDNVFIRLNNTLPLNTAVSLENFNLYLSAVVEDYSPNDADIESKVAEYKQTADQNYASLQTTVQNLDGTVQQNKTTAEQTAAGFKTRIESLETYKDGETTRASQYFESAKTETARQLTVERTAIAKDYVAKSTYTSDVTGIRNDLTATTTTANTTKTNLANYQASNDRAVANLQSSLQTTNGNVSSLQTKVEAVPGQITSAVSAVEGKIPTNVSTRNLILKSNDFANPHKQQGSSANTTITSTNEYFVIKTIGETNVGWGGISWNLAISEVKAGEVFSIFMPVYIDSSVDLDGGFQIELKRHVPGTNAYVHIIQDTQKDRWFNVAITFKTERDVVFDSYPFYVRLLKNGLVRIKPPMLVRGNLIPSDYQQAPEDTISQISSLSSQIQQTADGITLLATKTELNSAKTELQSGISTATNKANAAQGTANNNAQTISTHTTQISALNTGLQAKVSQSDFNTLSGRVTTAENNITAKANELSSKITSVEGKIPTSIGGRNYIKNSEYRKVTIRVDENQNQDEAFDISSAFWQNSNVYAKKIKLSFYYQASVAYETERKFQVLFRTKPWPSIGEVTYPANTTRPIKYTIAMTNALPADFTAEQIFIRFSGNLDKGRYHNISKVMLEVSDVFGDWQPAPEDAIEEISSLSSELKQTKDGITLLATKTELNTAKNELQSGITTATNKANAAQNTANSAQNTANSAQNKANSNAQTINTHTTQISALNTGLQAKVSQTEFNTLSGRVTTAENNITAKANELSSKITSVEGKIPTSIGGRNLWIQSKVAGKFVEETLPDNHVTGQKKCYRINSGEEMRFNIEPDFSSRLYRKVTLSAWIKYDGVVPGGNHWNKFNVFKHNFTYHNSETGASSDIDHSTLVNYTGTSDWKHVHFTVDYSARTGYDQLKGTLFFNLEGTKSGTAWVTGVKVEIGSIMSDYTPAPEDTAEQISNLSSEIKQTADGMTLLATKTELNTAKTELQSGINTATNKANSAQSTANNNAQTISTHTNQISALNTGLQAKVSQTEFNTLSGRVTNAENNITAKANELSSKITSVEGKIPTSIGGRNYIKNSEYRKVTIRVDENQNQDEAFDISSAFWQNSNVYAKKIKLSFYYQASVAYETERKFQVLFRTKPWPSIGEVTYPANTTRPIKYTMAMTNALPANFTANQIFIRFTGNLDKGRDHIITKVMLEVSDVFSDWQPAPEDTIEEISNLSSEFKQTTDAIKASVTSLDNSTVKSSSLTINADGIVMKAGKSTTDVANAIGSYFSVNQNAINLFSDKINVKGSMIVSGAITSDKIASKSINTAHLNGKIITADVISSNAVTTGAIKAGAVTTDKMSANSINGDRIAAGTLDAAKIKAGSITASQIASGTITSNQIKAGGISSANIAAGAITGDKIAAGAIDANKIAANAITANMIRGGQLNSTNGATVFDLNAGTLTFNNNYGYIQRVASDKVFEITTHLSTSSGSQEFLTSAFNIRKSDNSRQAGVKFTLYNTVADKPTAEAKINADALILYDSQSTRLFSMHGKSTFAGSVNFQGWGDIPIAKIHGGLVVNDIGIGSHMKPLLAIVEELCKKAGILWV